MSPKEKAQLAAIRGQLAALTNLVNALLMDDAAPVDKTPEADPAACRKCGVNDWLSVGGMGGAPATQMCRNCGEEK